MRRLSWALALFISVAIISCTKEFSFENSPPTELVAYGPDPVTPSDSVKPKTILVDASKDGGVWWFPQADSFSDSAMHQGKPLADYFRSLGYTVDELPRGKIVTKEELKPYKYVIRVGGFATYQAEELAAYDSCLKESSSLLYLNDHLTYFPNDALSEHLGLDFTGAITGNITNFVDHNITSQVTTLPYIAGSYITNPNPDKITVLGYMQLADAAHTQVAAMGVLKHPTSKIFFMGDSNCIESLPQPFTKNLVAWLFQ